MAEQQAHTGSEGFDHLSPVQGVGMLSDRSAAALFRARKIRSHNQWMRGTLWKNLRLRPDAPAQ
jgi:hypothetical protein